MSEFRLTQISDAHLARRLPGLTGNFHRVCDYIDANRPDLLVNSGDLAFDGPTNPDDLEFAHGLHAALPVPCRYLPGNHDIGDNPANAGPTPVAPGYGTGSPKFSCGLRRGLLVLPGGRVVFHRAKFAGNEHRAFQRGKGDRVAKRATRRGERPACGPISAQAVVP